LEKRSITANSVGVMKSPTVVADSMPPMIVTPTAWRAPAPVPVEVASGSTPKMKASTIMSTARKRSTAPNLPASAIGIPYWHPFLVTFLRELNDQDSII